VAVIFFPYFVGENEVGTNILLFVVFMNSWLFAGEPAFRLLYIVSRSRR